MATSKPLWPRVPPGFVKDQLLAHKLLGLALAAVMYLVCITGAIAVFYAELERWERPGVPEMAHASPEAVGRAVAYARAHIAAIGATPSDVFVITPSAEMPRLLVDYESDVLAFDAEGNYAGFGAHELTHFLTELHYALHLPWQIGFILVGILGVLLVALIVGGALSLPRMFRDAFTLRLDGGRRVSRVDIHNRLAVWGLPFHLIVAASGAVMGIALVAITLAGPILFAGDGARAMGAMYGDVAALAARAHRAGAPAATAASEAGIVAALHTLAEERPGNPPIYIALNQFNTRNELVSIGAGHGGRLIYSETYRFAANGALMSADGYAEGDLGRQVMASMFRVHAGAFGGVAVKLLYLALGLALSFICTTGVDIWLAKSAARGRAYPRLHAAWTSFVWATPAMLAAASTLHLLVGAPPVPVFWSGLLLLSLAGVATPQRILRMAAPPATGLLLLSVPLAHAATFGAAAATPPALAINLAFAATAFALLVAAIPGTQAQSTAQRARSADH
ncbi:PepSY-associated TM helix domain-containing protein [Terricaulis sp.]|uniref:PepSY-associated TM helix domain-containing protein n=1 Tax=Terricaulis sp. TaxID=2768686 RepID=UPI0037847443